MDMHITGKNIEISPSVRDYITRKLGKINRFLTNILSFDVVVSEEQTRASIHRFIVQVTLDNNGTLIRSEERGPDISTATDKVFEVMNHQIERYKGKLPYNRKRGTPSIRTSTAEVVAPELDETDEPEPKVVKTKRFDVKPMSLDEAMDQMELLGHDFFLYFNPDNNKINLLYRRKDGNYGLIEPNMR